MGGRHKALAAMGPITLPAQLGLGAGAAFALLLWLPAMTASIVGAACFDAKSGRHGRYFGGNAGIWTSAAAIIGLLESAGRAGLFTTPGVLRAEDGLTEAARNDFRRVLDLASGGDRLGRLAALQDWLAKPDRVPY